MSRTSIRLAVALTVLAALHVGSARFEVGSARFEVGSGFSRTVSAQDAPKQAVIETSAGTIVLDLLPEAAPNTVAFFRKTAESGGYDNTVFHRAVRNGMVQGGDPLSKDPGKKAQYGTGGLNQLKAETRAPRMTSGSVATVLVPGKADSGGSQFFIVLADQPSLDNQYTVFAKVADGMEVLQQISAMPTDAAGSIVDRVEIRKVTIRDTPPVPFVNDTVQQLGAYKAVAETSAGDITIEFFADKAPETVRQFLRMADAGVYNNMAFHRVAPGFVIQTGALSTRTAPLSPRQQALVHDLQPEFNDTKHVKGIVSMARGESPTSAQTSFFICTGTSPALDGVYTAFGRVVEGMSVVEAIEATPRTGEAPNTRIDLKTIRIVKP
jgi:peptidyl-prolyl cis-trans isomerase B (cyclophilin B)